MSETAAKKYCLNCFRVLEANTQECPHCHYLQPTAFNSTYLKPPYRLGQQYILGRVLGHGGFAITYLGYDRSLGTRVAIKEYFPAEFATRAPDGENVLPYSGERETLFKLGKEKFIAEARLLATLRNPNIIGIRQFLEGCNTAYFVMEYLEGQTLKEYINNNNGQLTWPEVKDLLLPIMGALEEIHRKQCYHRDIKPDNIYITKQGQPILLDFGAARQQMSGATTNLLAFLTPGFAPAEQYSANGIQGPWTDIYSLAATIYLALTGQVPPVPQDRAMGEIELIPPSKLGIKISPQEEEWLLKGLEVKWSHRPESVEQWRKMLEKHLTQTVEMKADDLKREMEMAFLRSAILPRLMSRFLTPSAETEIQEAATFVGIKPENVEKLIEQALLMTGSERRTPNRNNPPAQPVPDIPMATATKHDEVRASSRERVVQEKLKDSEIKPPVKTQQKTITPQDIGRLAPRIRNSLGMEFVLIKPYEIVNGKTSYQRFNMGSDNRPYWITLTQPYYLQTTQITQGQWRVVMGNNPSKFHGDEWQPVENVAWNDISPFLDRLNMLNEGYYRLPTEAEWYFACQGTNHDRYSFGNEQEKLSDYAWHEENAQNRPHAVGMKKANRFGLYDMHGNVWEWISDRFGAFPIGDFRDPKGPDRGDSRVMRGGSFNLSANYCTSKSRNYESPSFKASNLGLRLLLEAR